MARRATFLRSLKGEPDSGTPVFLLAGTEEFLRSDWPSDKLPATTVTAMAKAYEAMGYDAVFLAPNEAGLADLHFGEFPGNFIRLRPAVSTRILESAGTRLGLVLFPTDVAGDGTAPGPDDFQAVVSAARALRPKVDFVAGVSAWGAAAEERFLQQAQPVFDALLGSGPGSVRGRLAASRKTFWVRSHSEGRSVMVLQFFERPVEGRKWTPGEDARLEAVRLGDDFADAPDIKRLFQPNE